MYLLLCKTKDIELLYEKDERENFQLVTMLQKNKLWNSLIMNSELVAKMNRTFTPTKNRFESKSYKMSKVQCKICKRKEVIIRTLGINLCRQCFRERAKSIGFVKV